jgi:DNA-binding beta-propeller fold protein YncE
MAVRPRSLLVFAVLLLAGCGGASSRPDLVWGRKGVRDGDLIRPRAAVIDREDRLYIVDFTARIQAYDLDGNYLGLTFQTPDYRKGRPSGLALDREGNLLVSDSHYNCFRIYDSDGKQIRVIAPGAGSESGKLGYVSDVVQDDDGYFYVAEFGEIQRISKFDNDGHYLRSWGSQGSEPGQFARVRALALGPDGLLYAADACNHRIQVFDRDGTLVRIFGTQGSEPGQLYYPYDLAFGPKGNLYVVEYGNGRVQKFTPTGESLGTWGSPGREPGCFDRPWALVVDRKGRIHVLDTENHRVQRIAF